MKSVTEKQKKNIHFTYEDRLILEYYLNGKSHFPKITNTQKKNWDLRKIKEKKMTVIIMKKKKD